MWVEYIHSLYPVSHTSQPSVPNLKVYKPIEIIVYSKPPHRRLFNLFQDELNLKKIERWHFIKATKNSIYNLFLHTPFCLFPRLSCSRRRLRNGRRPHYADKHVPLADVSKLSPLRSPPEVLRFDCISRSLPESFFLRRYRSRNRFLVWDCVLSIAIDRSELVFNLYRIHYRGYSSVD